MSRRERLRIIRSLISLRGSSAGRRGQRHGHGQGSAFRAVANRNYRLYALGGMLSFTGTWMQRVAQDWLVLLLADGTALGITSALQFLPTLILSPYAGLLADRVPRLRIVKITQSTMALTALILGTLAVAGRAEVWEVYVLAFIFGSATAFDTPARQVLVSDMVGLDDLPSAVGLNSASFNLGRLVGPAIAGVLIGVLGGGLRGTGVVIIGNSLSYLAVLLALRLMRTGEFRRVPRLQRQRGQLREAMQHLRSSPQLMVVIWIIAFAGAFGLNFQVASTLMVIHEFGRGAAEYGLATSLTAIGSLVGALVGARRVGARPRLVVVAGFAFGVVQILTGMSPSFGAYLAAVPVMGLVAMTLTTAANTAVQISTPRVLRGRVMSLYFMVFTGSAALGSPVIGWAGQEFGARWTLFVGGGMSIVGVLCALSVAGRIVTPVATGRSGNPREGSRTTANVPPSHNE